MALAYVRGNWLPFWYWKSWRGCGEQKRVDQSIVPKVKSHPIAHHLALIITEFILDDSESEDSVTKTRTDASTVAQ